MKEYIKDFSIKNNTNIKRWVLLLFILLIVAVYTVIVYMAGVKSINNCYILATKIKQKKETEMKLKMLDTLTNQTSIQHSKISDEIEDLINKIKEGKF